MGRAGQSRNALIAQRLAVAVVRTKAQPADASEIGAGGELGAHRPGFVNVERFDGGHSEEILGMRQESPRLDDHLLDEAAVKGPGEQPVGERPDPLRLVAGQQLPLAPRELVRLLSPPAQPRQLDLHADELAAGVASRCQVVGEAEPDGVVSGGPQDCRHHSLNGISHRILSPLWKTMPAADSHRPQGDFQPVRTAVHKPSYGDVCPR